MKTLNLNQKELSKIHDVLVIEFVDQELIRESDETNNPHILLAKFQDTSLASALETLQEIVEISSFTILEESEIKDNEIDYDFTILEEL